MGMKRIRLDGSVVEIISSSLLVVGAARPGTRCTRYRAQLLLDGSPPFCDFEECMSEETPWQLLFSN